MSKTLVIGTIAGVLLVFILGGIFLWGTQSVLALFVTTFVFLVGWGIWRSWREKYWLRFVGVVITFFVNIVVSAFFYYDSHGAM